MNVQGVSLSTTITNHLLLYLAILVKRNKREIKIRNWCSFVVETMFCVTEIKVRIKTSKASRIIYVDSEKRLSYIVFPAD